MNYLIENYYKLKAKSEALNEDTGLSVCKICIKIIVMGTREVKRNINSCTIQIKVQIIQQAMFCTPIIFKI